MTLMYKAEAAPSLNIVCSSIRKKTNSEKIAVLPYCKPWYRKSCNPRDSHLIYIDLATLSIEHMWQDLELCPECFINNRATNSQAKKEPTKRFWHWRLLTEGSCWRIEINFNEHVAPLVDGYSCKVRWWHRYLSHQFWRHYVTKITRHTQKTKISAIRGWQMTANATL